ncbi:MAG: hypothetical protein ACKVOR_11340 [Flavobacteriales bacterium]
MKCIISALLLIASFSSISQSNGSQLTKIFEADSITIAIETDLGDVIEHQIISINHRNGNWYEVLYTNSKDKQIKRIVHKSRLRKFGRQLVNGRLVLHNCDDYKEIDIVCTTNNGRESLHFNHCKASKQLEKWLRILKIW